MAILKKVRVLSKPFPAGKKLKPSQPSFYVFREKSTGAAQLRSEAGTDMNCTIERMAGQLAMQCMVRGYDPHDFEILVAADEALVDRLLARAKALLDEGRAAVTPSSLSPRQKEILHSVIRNQANKEIASDLNITVRTVKFHISTLLNRFGVQNRSELARRAETMLRPAAEETFDWGRQAARKSLELLAMNAPRESQFSKRELTA